ncbi:MAG: hypothetical protein VB010_03375 [Sphaerochaeta associata]|uniref:hypothetical protein n=1 Tax=Sphaerochaeta associata TaxID=1129264 RepID=UPI002B202CF6|nr:hypothetical protein [Sphaerochaeta associata]MEA5106381.1 hypothetical protein [Sphaerochaeta associata]
MNSKTADYQFIVKELPNSSQQVVWGLECYPQTKQFECLEKSLIYIRFKSGTTEAQAKEIKEILNNSVDDFVIAP